MRKSDRENRIYKRYNEDVVQQYILNQVPKRILYRMQKLSLPLMYFLNKTEISKPTWYQRILEGKGIAVSKYFLIASVLEITIGELLSYNDIGIFDCTDYVEWKNMYCNRRE